MRKSQLDEAANEEGASYDLPDIAIDPSVTSDPLVVVQRGWANAARQGLARESAQQEQDRRMENLRAAEEERRKAEMAALVATPDTGVAAASR